MSNGNPTALQAVQAFLQRQKIDCELSDIQSGTQVTVRSGAMKAILNVYSSGKLVVGGADSSLKNTLEKLKAALESGEAIAGQALPFEIESFPDAIRQKVPNCDPVIVAFVEEAIKCIKCDALLAAAFMIGAASERAVNILIHAYCDSIKDDANKARFSQKIANKVISKKFDEFMASYKSCKSKPVDVVLSHDLEVLIGGMFQFCRITRNEIGHPQIVPDLNKGVLLANLAHFVTYIERIYSLVKHFQTGGVIL